MLDFLFACCIVLLLAIIAIVLMGIGAALAHWSYDIAHGWWS